MFLEKIFQIGLLVSNSLDFSTTLFLGFSREGFKEYNPVSDIIGLKYFLCLYVLVNAIYFIVISILLNRRFNSFQVPKAIVFLVLISSTVFRLICGIHNLTLMF